MRYNRFAPGTRGLLVEGEFSVDARYNWWGCNAGPTDAACAKLDERGAVSVARWPWLTLSLTTDRNRIENANGGTTGWRASLLRDSVGGVHQPQRLFPDDGFVVLYQTGTRVTTGYLDRGVVGGMLTADGAQGVDFGVRFDSETARVRVDYGPAPVVPLARECTSSARLLSCTLDAKVARATKAVLNRAGRRVAAGRVRVSGATVRVSVTRRVRAGRYELVLTDGSRRVARLTVVVR